MLLRCPIIRYIKINNSTYASSYTSSFKMARISFKTHFTGTLVGKNVWSACLIATLILIIIYSENYASQYIYHCYSPTSITTTASVKRTEVYLGSGRCWEWGNIWWNVFLPYHGYTKLRGHKNEDFIVLYNNTECREIVCHLPDPYTYNATLSDDLSTCTGYSHIMLDPERYVPCLMFNIPRATFDIFLVLAVYGGIDWVMLEITWRILGVVRPKTWFPFIKKLFNGTVETCCGKERV